METVIVKSTLPLGSHIAVLLVLVAVVIHGEEISCAFCPNCTEPLPVRCCPSGFYWDGNFTILASAESIVSVESTSSPAAAAAATDFPLKSSDGGIESLTPSINSNCLACSEAIEGCAVCKRRGSQENVTCDECSNTALTLIDNRCERLNTSIVSLVLTIIGSTLVVVILSVGAVVYALIRFHWLSNLLNEDARPPTLPTVSQLDWPPPRRTSEEASAGRKRSTLRPMRSLSRMTSARDNDCRSYIPSVHYQSNSCSPAAFQTTKTPAAHKNSRQITKKKKAISSVNSGNDASYVNNSDVTSHSITIHQDNVYLNTLPSGLWEVTQPTPAGASHMAAGTASGPSEEEYANFRELSSRNDVILSEHDNREVYENMEFKTQR